MHDLLFRSETAAAPSRGPAVTAGFAYGPSVPCGGEGAADYGRAAGTGKGRRCTGKGRRRTGKGGREHGQGWPGARARAETSSGHRDRPTVARPYDEA